LSWYKKIRRRAQDGAGSCAVIRGQKSEASVSPIFVWHIINKADPGPQLRKWPGIFLLEKLG